MGRKPKKESDKVVFTNVNLKLGPDDLHNWNEIKTICKTGNIDTLRMLMNLFK